MTSQATEILTQYDITLVFKSDLTKTEIKETIQKFIQNLKFWKSICYEAMYLGKKPLAYEMKKDSHGIFIVMKIATSPAAITRFQETIRLTENIIRSQIIKY